MTTTTSNTDRWTQPSHSRFWLRIVPPLFTQDIEIHRTNEMREFALARIYKTDGKIYVSYGSSSKATVEQVREMASILDLAGTIAANFDDYYQQE